MAIFQPAEGRTQEHGVQLIRSSVEDLIIQLARQNRNEARLLAESTRSARREMLKARGALDAARDAAMEWRALPTNTNEKKGL